MAPISISWDLWQNLLNKKYHISVDFWQSGNKFREKRQILGFHLSLEIAYFEQF